jgi:MFS family permease
MGYPAAEAFWPLLAVFSLGFMAAKTVWIFIAAVLAFVVAPILLALLSRGRSPAGGVEGGSSTGMQGRHWSRSEAVRHWLFAALVPMILTAGFIGTVVYFHQVSIAQDKGWTLAAMAPGYVSYAILATAGALAGGWIADRFGPEHLLPVALLPMGAGITLVWLAQTVPLWFAALGLIGLTHGLNSALWGAFLPAVYGTRHLGSVRSLVTAIMVVSTAIGPGLTGLLIDWGVRFPVQSLFMGAWCFGLSAFALFVRRKLVAETRQDNSIPKPAAG